MGASDRASAELIFGELIGNVVRHANGNSVVDVAVDHPILHVFDRGAGFVNTSRLPIDPYAETGRDLFLIASLAVDFGVSERHGGGSHARVVLHGGSNRRCEPPKRGRVQAVRALS